MGRLFIEHLCGGRVYACKYCACPLAATEDLVSKSFHSRAGKAYLFDNVVNVTMGRSEERLMTTGLHVVVDINCVSCCSLLGWKYEFARETSQKYKEGKFILERGKMEVVLPSDQLSENSSQSQEDSEWGPQDSDSEDACI